MARIEKQKVVLPGKIESYPALASLVEAGILREERHLYGYTWALVGDEVPMVRHQVPGKTYFVVEGIVALWRQDPHSKTRWEFLPMDADRMTRILGGGRR